MPFDLAAALQCPLLGRHGGPDRSIDTGNVKGAAAKGKDAGEAVVYPVTPHGFPADYRPGDRKADAEDGWRRALDWFHHYGVG